jgi:hypothetical protein
MPINRKSLFALSVFSILAFACDRPSVIHIQDDIRASLNENKNAKTRSDWDSSDNNNEVLFKRWKDSNTDSQIICKAFADKTGQELSLFEEEIKSEEYQSLVAPCRDPLIEKIETYWRQEKYKLNIAKKEEPAPSPSPEPIPTPNPNPTPLPFKFPNNRQTRDVFKRL